MILIQVNGNVLTACPPHLIPPLLVGFAVDKKFVLTLLFPKAGAGGGLLGVERGPVKSQTSNHKHGLNEPHCPEHWLHYGALKQGSFL